MVTQKNRFCKCIKAVKAKGIGEQQAIAICVKSVLHTKGKTLKKFKCGKKGRLVTQKLKKSRT
jgi:hypothetical protein